MVCQENYKWFVCCGMTLEAWGKWGEFQIGNEELLEGPAGSAVPPEIQSERGRF